MFEDRREAFETKFKYENEMDFKIEAKGAKLLGDWGATKLGLSEQHSEDFVLDIVNEHVERTHPDGVLGKLCDKLEAEGVDVSRYRVEKRFEQFKEKAREEIYTS